jgi:hypothetical protein
MLLKIICMRRFINCITLVIFSLTACKQEPSSNDNTAITPVDSTSRGGCFLHALNKDSTFLELNLANGQATGKFFWLPDQKDRANGVLEGTYQGDTIRVKYTYMIEGNLQEEDKILVLERDSISVLYGPLEVQGNKFTIKDETNLKVAIRMGRADCATFQIPAFKKE